MEIFSEPHLKDIGLYELELVNGLNRVLVLGDISPTGNESSLIGL